MKKLLAFAFLFLASCAPKIPYTTESNVGPVSPHWASGTGTVIKSVTVHNPLQKPTQALVHCEGNLDEGKQERWFSLASGAETRFLVEVPVRFQIGEACFVVRYL